MCCNLDPGGLIREPEGWSLERRLAIKAGSVAKSIAPCSPKPLARRNRQEKSGVKQKTQFAPIRSRLLKIIKALCVSGFAVTEALASAATRRSAAVRAMHRRPRRRSLRRQRRQHSSNGRALPAGGSAALRARTTHASAHPWKHPLRGCLYYARARAGTDARARPVRRSSPPRG